MVKRRDKTYDSIATAEAVERFSSGAYGAPASAIDPDAKPTFKHFNIGFNEYDYRLLERLAKKQRRSKLSVIRMLIRDSAESDGE